MALSLQDLPASQTTARPVRNRRRGARVRHPFKVSVNGDKRPWRGIDLSQGGMLCTAAEPLWPGNIVHATLLVPNAPTLDVQGEVVELVPYGDDVAMRVCFSPLDTQTSAELSSMMVSLGKLS